MQHNCFGSRPKLACAWRNLAVRLGVAANSSNIPLMVVTAKVTTGILASKSFKTCAQCNHGPTTQHCQHTNCRLCAAQGQQKMPYVVNVSIAPEIASQTSVSPSLGSTPSSSESSSALSAWVWNNVAAFWKAFALSETMQNTNILSLASSSIVLFSELATCSRGKI